MSSISCHVAFQACLPVQGNMRPAKGRQKLAISACVLTSPHVCRASFKRAVRYTCATRSRYKGLCSLRNAQSASFRGSMHDSQGLPRDLNFRKLMSGLRPCWRSLFTLLFPPEVFLGALQRSGNAQGRAASGRTSRTSLLPPHCGS